MIGTIFDIKRFAVHDGPGIRSTVFLKGCPLSCIWCHNPEGINQKINLWYFENKCIKCNQCISSCKNHSLSPQDNPLPHIGINIDTCTNAGACVDVCPTGALSFDGKKISSDDVIDSLMDDQIFYTQSSGGITLSGGEPLYQSDFALEILQGCKSKGLHTAIETCLYAHTEVLERFLPYVDLFIADMKLFDTFDHKRYTSVPNELIKKNISFLAKKQANILIRIPLIPGITANEDNLKKIAAFIHQLRPDINIELMNYNILAESKYRIMNKNYSLLHDAKNFNEDELNHFRSIITSEGISVLDDI